MSDIAFRSAVQLAAAIRSKEISSRELLDHYLRRVDRFKPAINAVVTFDLPTSSAPTMSCSAQSHPPPRFRTITASRSTSGPSASTASPVHTWIKLRGPA